MYVSDRYTNRRTADINREKNDSGSQQRLTDSGFHHFELGWFKVTNLLPNSIYTVRVFLFRNFPNVKNFLAAAFIKIAITFITSCFYGSSDEFSTTDQRGKDLKEGQKDGGWTDWKRI